MRDILNQCRLSGGFTPGQNLGLNGNDPKSAISNILKNADKKDSLDSCLEAIKEVSPYLSHPQKEIKELAACVLCKLVQKAAIKLATEKDPEKIKEAAGILLNVIEKLENKGFGSDELKESKKLIMAKLALNDKGLKKDEFSLSKPLLY